MTSRLVALYSWQKKVKNEKKNGDGRGTISTGIALAKLGIESRHKTEQQQGEQTKRLWNI